MENYIKQQLLNNIEGISYDAEKQVAEYHKTKGGASVIELINTWFDFMPDKLPIMKAEKSIDVNEEAMLLEFHQVIERIAGKISNQPDDLDVFKNNPEWSELREKAKELLNKLSR